MLLAAALSPPRESPNPLDDEFLSVDLVVPAHNEASGIDRMLAAIDALDYPKERLFVVLVDDGSTDGTARHMRDWSAAHPSSQVLELPDRVGKSVAINKAIALGPASELTFVCDADLRPRPDCLAKLVPAFSDESVGAAAAFLSPENAGASLVANYAAVESWVHQLVTSAGKDRLDLGPPALGASVFRRSALEAVGCFPTGVPGGDVRVTVQLMRLGWRTRFIPSAVAENAVVDRWSDYWYQHTRWVRNNLAAASREGRSTAPVAAMRRLEIAASSAGYADRLALMAALVLGRARRISLWLASAYLLIRALEVNVAVRKAGVQQGSRYLRATLVMFGVDVVASVAGVASHLLRRRRGWRRPPRHPDGVSAAPPASGR